MNVEEIKWEHGIIRGNFSDTEKEKQFLNEMGQNGWQNYHIYHYPNNVAQVYYFKRRSPSEYQSQLAAAFVEEYDKFCDENHLESILRDESLEQIANNAAKRFITSISK